MNIKIIVNPHAGEGRARNIGFSVEKFLCERGIEYSLDSTYRPGGAVSLAKKATQNGFNLIIAVGGDGTINEVSNGMIGTDTSLAIIPAGEKNNLAKAFGIPMDNISGACQIALAGKSINMDVGKINDKYFLNGVEIGFSAEAISKSSQKNRFVRGRLGKMLDLVSLMPKFKAPNIKIKMGEVINESETLFLSVANGKNSQGGFHDNLFDVCMAKYPGKAKFIYHMPKLISGRYSKLPFFSFLKTPVIEIDSINPLAVTYDGEIMKTNAPYRINIAENKLSVKTA